MERSTLVRRILIYAAPLLVFWSVGTLVGIVTVLLGMREAPSGWIVVRIGAVTLALSILMLMLALWKLYPIVRAALMSTPASTFRDPVLAQWERRVRIRLAIRTDQDVLLEDRSAAVTYLEQQRQPGWQLAFGGIGALLISERMIASAASDGSATTRSVLALTALTMVSILAATVWRQWRLHRWQRRHLAFDQTAPDPHQ